MSVHNPDIKRVTTHTLQELKSKKEKISCLTAYDYSMAKLIDAAGIEIILVGDSASNVMAGHETTLPITLDQMIYHAQSVVRAVKRALVVVDLPFGSYQGSSEEALRSAVRIMKESGAHAVKMEGGEEIRKSISRVLSAGIPVMGHIGLTPQSVHTLGGYRVQG
ncbi:MAG: 3-methyl-2-oxobutanoate hydroxymethyltransferase, partial [Siphonobacter aquaeclarae]|nr:3-methyl-2-oxobutanoate hydroxymethyltransferase [Siphonobacter aquaeclarae]